MSKAAVLACLCTAAVPFLTSANAQTSMGNDVEYETGFSTEALEDALALCDIVREHYVYLESREAIWDATCKEANKLAVEPDAETAGGHLALLESMLDELFDNHVSLNTNSSVSPRLVPSGSDYWLGFSDGQAVVGAVRPGSGAAAAGLKVGDKVTGLNGAPVLSEAMGRIRHGREAVSADRLVWALNAQAAGYRGAPRSVTVERDGVETLLELGDPEPTRPALPVTWRRLDGNLGYIRIEDSLGDETAVAAFDKALSDLRGVKGWVIDLRNTPSGGNTGVAEPILGRFVRSVKPYQKAGPRWDGEAVRYVASRGPWRVKKPVVVLVGRWTGSMGEGMAVGFDGLKRADVFGSPMAALAGGVEGFELPASGWSVRLPTYNLYHMDGTERHDWHPPHSVVADNGDGPDLALKAAADWLTR